MKYITPFTKTEGIVLTAFNSKPRGYLFTHRELSEFVYGTSDRYSEHALKTYISRLRKILGYNAITTVKGIGYILGEIEVCKECDGTGYKTIG